MRIDVSDGFLITAIAFLAFGLLSSSAQAVPRLASRGGPVSQRMDSCRLGSLSVAALLLVSGIVRRYIETGIPPFATTRQFAAVFALGAVLGGLALQTSGRSARTLVTGIASALAIALVAWSATSTETLEGLSPALQNNPLFVSHVLVAALAYGSFLVAFPAAIGQLAVGEKNVARRTLLQELERVEYQAIRAGFPLFTLAILLGSIWADVAWGTYWNWDPKETASLATWLIYGLYLHARGSRWWTRKRRALLVVLGFAAVVITFFGSFVFTGLHAYN